MLKIIFQELQHENSIQIWKRRPDVFKFELIPVSVVCIRNRTSIIYLHYNKPLIILPLASTEKRIFDFRCVTKNSVILSL